MSTCVHERHGPYREVTISGNGQMGWLWCADIDLRLFLSGWARVFAIAEDTPRGTQRKPEVFDRQAWRCTRSSLTERSEVSAWARGLERFRAEAQCAELDLQPLPEAEPLRARCGDRRRQPAGGAGPT